MNLSHLPDLAGMLILMGILVRLRKTYRGANVDLWLLGLTFVLVEAVAFALIKGAGEMQTWCHAIALDAYVMAAIIFGWAARGPVLQSSRRVAMFVLPALPMLAVDTAYGLECKWTKFYLYGIGAGLALGVLPGLLIRQCARRERTALVAVQAALWIPMLGMAYRGLNRNAVYWGLAGLYLLVAFCFRTHVRRGSIGGGVIVGGFVVWALCFLLHPYTRGSSYDDVLEQVWTMQKFLVTIGMLLVLLEEETLKRKQEAMHDSLTGLPNRRLFEDRLAQAMARSRRSGRSMAIFVIDLNQFKKINDTCGHRAGDEVLTQTARALQKMIHGSDTLARYGGDEFSVIVSELAELSDCTLFAAALRRVIASVEPPGGKPSMMVSASVGFAIYPEDAETPETLVEAADLRMYAEKRGMVRNTHWTREIAGPSAMRGEGY